MNTVLVKYYQEFAANKDIVSFIKLFSVSTWQKIGFVRSKDKLKMHETTVTQNLLFQFQLLADQCPQAVQMYESKSENTRGNDMEIFIKTSRGYVAFPCQAKISYKQKGKKFKPEPYTAINHPLEDSKGVKQQQARTLIDYAHLVGGVPIYLFYNHCADVPTKDSITKVTGLDAEVYGCSYMNAEVLCQAYLRGIKWTPIPNFSLIHPSKAKPFFKLFELLNRNRFSDPLMEDATFGKIISNEEFDQLRQYSIEELNEDDYWRKSSSLSELDTGQYSNLSTTDNDDDGTFNPSIRIVLSEDIQGFPSQLLSML